MSPTTKSQSQSSSSSSNMPQNPDKKGADSNTKQEKQRSYTTEDLKRDFREAEKKAQNMTREEAEKLLPWLKTWKMTPGDELPDGFWDDI